MYKNKKILAIIPARGGSKGLPGKNIKLLAGKPLIAWTIESAKECPYIDEIFVSTDCQNIAKVSEEFGAKVPHLRPIELAKDESTSMDVVLYTIDYFEKMGKTFDFVMMLEATSPLRKNDDLKKAIERLVNNPEAESIVGVCKVEAHHPAFLVKKENGFLRPYLNQEVKVLRRQELDELYFFEGSLYISKVSTIKEKKNFYHSKTLLYEVEKWQSFEVDDMVDFKIIESLMDMKEKM